MRAYTNDPLVSPVTNQELADWLYLDDDTDPLLPVMTVTATQAVVDYMQRDLLPRAWILTHEDWPSVSPARRYSDVTFDFTCFKRVIDLPYAGAISVDTVTVYGEETTEYRLLDSLPSKIKFHYRATVTDENEPAIVVNYTAGMGATPADIPQAIKTAILMIAAYMFEHRGQCDAETAIKDTGAATVLQPFRVAAGLVV